MNSTVNMTSGNYSYTPWTAPAQPTMLPVAPTAPAVGGTDQYMNQTLQLATPNQLFAAAPIPAAAISWDANQVPALPIQQNAQPFYNASTYNPQQFTLTALNISQTDLQWATDLENKVKAGNYQPNDQEKAYYQNLTGQLEALRNNIQPLTPTPDLPYMENYQTAQPGNVPTGNAPVDQTAAPTGPMKQVTMSEIEWALSVEEKVQKRGYQPTPEENTRYQDILARFKANPKIKTELWDALAAQSPWIGANVASIRYTKIVSSQVSSVVSGIKNGTGTVLAGLKGFGMTALKSTGLSALVSAGFSAVTNGIAVMQGKKSKEQAIVNVVSDTVTGAATGLGATVGGGLAMAALATTSLVGWPVTLLVGGASILGGWLADKLLTKSGAKTWVKDQVSKMVEKSSQPAQTMVPVQQAMPQAGY